MLFTQEEQDQIVAAIKQSEQKTSGEIKVHVEELCPDSDVLERAKQVFFYLALDKTASHNGVLLYLAIKDRKHAVLGDSGIDALVPPLFWETTKNIMQGYFSAGKLVEGLIEGVHSVGNQLEKYYPYQRGDINEISDEISFG